MARRWKRRPEGSNWGDFGDDDQIGRLNLLTPDKILQAAAEIKEGRNFCLSLPLDYPGGNYHQLQRHQPSLHPVNRNGRFIYNTRSRPDLTDARCDDYVVMFNQASTHWDALAHAGSAFDADGDGIDEIVYYNGYRAHEHIVGPVACPPDRLDSQMSLPMTHDLVAANALGVENMAAACVQGRGVMIDLYAAYGRERRLVGYEDLMRICDTDHVAVELGDIVCLHTGQTQALLEMRKKPDLDTLEKAYSGLDGHDKRLLRWIDESGLVAIVADNFSIESVPGRPGSDATCDEPLHELCLFKIGVHLGELWYLSELNTWLRSRGRTRFLLTAPPLRLPGAVASAVTPIATV